MITSSVSKSVFHQSIIIFVPGFLVALPLLSFLYLLLDSSKHEYAHLINLIESHTGLVYFVASILSILFGLILENVGSRLETKYDKLLKIKKSAWYFYLFDSCSEDSAKVIHKYIDTIVFRFKMELSLIPALGVFIIEWCLIFWESNGKMPLPIFVIVLLLSLAACQYMRSEAIISCGYLDKVRKKYMNHCGCFMPCIKCGQGTSEKCSECDQIPNDNRNLGEKNKLL